MCFYGFSVKKILINLVVLFSLLNLTGSVFAADTQLIGVWDYSDSREKYKIVIAEEDDETIMVKKFEDGIRIRQVVIESRRADGVVYSPEDETVEEYYVLDQTGNLQVWNILGLKVTLKADK